MMKLIGEIKRDTDKAIYFHIVEDEYHDLQCETVWFPKAKIRLPKKQDGRITIYAQEWLYDNKVKELKHRKERISNS